MAEHNELGKQGEELAAEYLAAKGYTILETNWRKARYEIDLIARNNQTIVVVEVKTRSGNYFGDPEIFVTRQKQKQIIKAANAYINQHNIDEEVRFDIISVIYTGKNPVVKHISDAFYPTLF